MVSYFDIPKKNYKVICDCITYNQASFITDTMDGFCMQQTSFPFVCYIIDDASTDGEQDVIRNYLENHFDQETAERYDLQYANVVVARHAVNRNCTFAVYLLKQNLWHKPKLKYQHRTPWLDRCEYLAFCEGDDYWIDKNKLQRQVDIMDADPLCSLCYHSSHNLFDNDYTGNRTPICENVEETYSSEDVLSGYPFQTASVVIRTSLFKTELFKNVDSKGNFTSSMLFLTASALGKMIGINEQMSVYRRCAGGISNMHSGTIRMNYVRTLVSVCQYFNVQIQKLILKKCIYGNLCSLRSQSFSLFFKTIGFIARHYPIYCFYYLWRDILKVIDKLFFSKNNTAICRNV